MSVALAYVHDKEITHSFHDSLTSLMMYDLANEQHLFGGSNHGPLKMRCGTDGLPGARNKVIRRVLDEGDEWLLWIDSDMGFLPDTLARMMEVADPVERPIIGGLCFAQKEIELDGYGGFVTRAGPTIMDWRKTDEDEGFAARSWFPPNTLVKCDGTGSALILIHRTVLEKIRDELGPIWYQRARLGDSAVAEDLSFCMRAGLLGFPIYVHTGIRTTHMKTQWLGESDFWEQAAAPPAAEETAVLVPVMRRPHQAKPFMQSLRASTGLAQVYAIAHGEDEATIAAWADAGANVITTTKETFAQKVNVGYAKTFQPWVFLVGDDARFRPGWLDHAQYAAGITGAAVVGTNDLANPAVMRGEHATHMLIRRDYIETTGASWDGPGIVCHEGYGHWFVDNELVIAAKQRGEWAMSLASKVEHFHPFYGTAETDEVYELGRSLADRDQTIFEARLSKHG